MAKKVKQPKETRLEDILLDCRNSLRGSASMTEKRDLLLTLVFLKFLYEKFKKQQHIIMERYKDNEGLAKLMLDQPSAYEQDGVFYLPEKCRWNLLLDVSATSLAVELDNALTELNKIERLKGSAPTQIFTGINLEPRVLADVMNNVEKIDPLKFGEKDLIGRVYEYFLREFSFQMKDNKEEGEFYTPHSIVKLIASLIEPYDGTIGDPCCGTGGMFIQSLKLIEAKGGNTKNVQVYGQESNKDTLRLAKMNLALRGISFDLGNRASSSFTDDQHIGKTVDYIMANPPFNLKKWRAEDQLTNDARWSGYGIPPASNANYAWILHILKKLDVTKGIAGFLLANGTLDDEDTVAIRQKLIENDKVEAIIVLPRNMFFSTDISVTLWILNNNKRARVRNGLQLRDRQREILFVDLRTWSQNVTEKKYVELRDDQIEAVCRIYKDWQTLPVDADGHHQPYEVPELYRSVGIKEIEENNWSLAPSRYIQFIDRDSQLDYKKLITESTSSLNQLISSQTSINEGLSNSLQFFGKDTSTQFEWRRIGDYIKLCDETNKENLSLPVLGINIEKRFMPTAANLTDVNLSKYKIVKRGRFVFSGMQTGRDICIRLGLYNEDTSALVSPAYTTFTIDENKGLLSEYLHLYFCREESDRYGWFISDSSIRANLDWERFADIKIPIPSLDVQKAIVKIYDCLTKTRKIADEIDSQLKSISPALIQYVVNN